VFGSFRMRDHLQKYRIPYCPQMRCFLHVREGIIYTL